MHTAVRVKQWLQEANMQILEWPTRSPDLNVIENYWHMLSSRVYAKGSFNTCDGLWKAIEDAAEDICQNHRDKIRNLINSLLEVIDKKGHTINA